MIVDEVLFHDVLERHVFLAFLVSRGSSAGWWMRLGRVSFAVLLRADTVQPGN